jgi:tetratricopeptide (TPR) repeat protein
MTVSDVCQRCGGALDRGECAACSGPLLARLVQREIAVLVVLCAVAVLAFVGTRAIARLDASIRAQDAAAWYRTGQARLAADDPAGAVEAFGHASSMAREHTSYRLALAAGLAAAGRDDAARQVLLGIRSVTPENPEVNLRIARLEVRRGDETAAIRHYQHALYGVWRDEDVEARGRVRVELIEYLIDRGQRGRALAELLALEGNLAPEPDAWLEAARLFHQAGDVSRALAYYERVLKADPAHAHAAAGAGEAAFALGDLPRAARYLRAAPDDRPEVVELRAVTTFVLSRDPLMPRLPYAERRRRLQLNLGDTIEQLRECPADGDTRAALDGWREEAEALGAALGRRGAPPSLETIESGVDLVYRIQQALATACAASDTTHRALLLIGERNQADPP